MVNSPYESSYQQSYKDVYECVMDINRKLGGRAIAAGGYGCVFRPALKCQGDPTRKPNTVSKLLTNTEAKAEMDEIETANRILSSIPNYQKYFAVTGYDTCIPDEVTGDDAVGFTSMCASPLGIKGNDKEVLTKFNNNLQKYRIIHSPDLGVDISKALKMLYDNVSKNARGAKFVLLNLKNVNNTMKMFIVNAITKLAQMDYYHSDVKPSNIMTNFSIDDIQNGTNFTEVKLIDFGLAYTLANVNDPKKDIPNSLVFNSPFSSILFDDGAIGKDIIRSLNTIFLKDVNTRAILEERMANPRAFYTLLEPFMEKFYSNYYKNGFHSEYIDFLEQTIQGFDTAYGKADPNKWRNSIKMYIGEIIRKYIRIKNVNGKDTIDINLTQYWKDAYRYNVDIWGALTTFIILVVSAISSSIATINKTMETTIVGYINLIYNFIYNPYYATRPIDVTLVGKALDTITQYITANANISNVTAKPVRSRLTAKRRIPNKTAITKGINQRSKNSKSRKNAVSMVTSKTKSSSSNRIQTLKKRGRQTSNSKSQVRKPMKLVR